MHKFNQWALAMERWVENPPADYLQFVQVWVQLRNIPVNHCTVEAITALGEFAGQVTEMVFDPSKAQSKDYVRLRVRFELVSLPSGEMVTILYDYERIQRKCYTCQRLADS